MKAPNNIVDTTEYSNLLDQLKSDIQRTQISAALSVTKELVNLYWRIGKRLSEKILESGWGTKVIEQVSKDVCDSFPNTSGFSYRNFYFMKQFAESYPEGISETAVSEIPWGHNIVLIQKIDNPCERLWYAQQTIENGWSRSMLVNWIDSNLFGRQGKAITNFQKTLPKLLRRSICRCHFRQRVLCNHHHLLLAKPCQTVTKDHKI